MSWVIGLGLPIAWMIFLLGWLRGYNRSEDSINWGTGYDEGWTAHERAMALDIAKQYGAEEEEE